MADARRPRRGKPAPKLPPGRPFLTPGGSARRHAVERRSAVFLLFLRGLPRLVPPLVALGVAAAGLAVPGPVGAACLVVVAALLFWLAYLSWPAVPPAGRAVRVGAAVLVLVGAAAQLVAD